MSDELLPAKVVLEGEVLRKLSSIFIEIEVDVSEFNEAMSKLRRQLGFGSEMLSRVWRMQPWESRKADIEMRGDELVNESEGGSVDGEFVAEG